MNVFFKPYFDSIFRTLYWHKILKSFANELYSVAKQGDAQT